MFDSNAATFFIQWMRNPRETGALVSSSQTLACVMAKHVDDDGHGTVIELGGGAGIITQALLQSGISPSRLIVIEKNPFMVDALHRRFSGVCIIQQDASRLCRVIDSERESQINTIVSGLPMLLLDRRKQYAIFKQAFSLMKSGGSFLQFTYGPSIPVCRQVLARLGVKGRRAAFVWRNAPPATVWHFSRAD